MRILSLLCNILLMPLFYEIKKDEIESSLYVKKENLQSKS